MADPVDEAAERLYGLPLDEFTAARNAAAKELRDRGLRDEADEVKALPKPSAAAWAVNQLTRRRHADLDEFLEAATAARDAQLGGSAAAEAREAVKEMRRALDRLVGAARDELGGKSSEAVLTRVRQGLEAAAVDDEAAEETRRPPAAGPQGEQQAGHGGRGAAGLQGGDGVDGEVDPVPGEDGDEQRE